MIAQLQTQTKAAQQPSFTPVQTSFLQRKCACGQHTIAGSECAECRQKREGTMQRAAVSPAPVNAVPPIVHDVLCSSGQPLDAGTRAFMEPRFGHDFSGVRIHTDDRAAESARAVNALAYTVGRDVVFGTGQYELGTSEGRRLMAHELTHVVQQGSTLQTNKGITQQENVYEEEADRTAKGVMQAQTEQQSLFSSQNLSVTKSVPIIQRDVQQDAAGNFSSFEFKIGDELSLQFVFLAKRLASDGSISDNDLRQLHAQALKARGTVNDHERMFMAGLLDPANVAKLQATIAITGVSITFTLASISTARLQHVIDLDRKSLPPSVTEPQKESLRAFKGLNLAEGIKHLGEAEDASLKEIVTSAGSFKTQATDLVAFVRVHTILPSEVLRAMKAAASDNSAGDQVMAGTVYAIAKEAGNSLVSDILSGRIKVDALIPSAFVKLKGLSGKEVAFYATVAQKTGQKGDTVYVQMNLDIANAYHRSIVIHELQHAQDDKAASPTGKVSFTPKSQLELAAYRTQARYILNQMSSQPVKEQMRSASNIVKEQNGIVLGAILLEGQRDKVRYQPILGIIFNAAKPPLHRNAAGVAQMMNVPPAKLEAAILADIDKAYGLKPGETGVVEGLAGESLIHLINRL